MPVTIDGKSTRMRRDEAFYEGLMRDALKGDNTARRMLLAAIHRLDQTEAEREAVTPAAVTGPADAEIIEKFRREVIENCLNEKAKAEELEEDDTP